MYYEYDGMPVKWNGDPGTIPEVLVRGEWIRYYQLDKFWSDVSEITKDEFDALVAQAMIGGAGP